VKTYKSSGVKFNIVNELPTQVRNRLLKTVNEFIQGRNDFDRVEAILNYIAGGACGKVYDLGDGFVVKINKFGWRSDTPDGDILKDLQGVPFIPKLYWYSEDNRFIVVQKIDGVTTSNYSFEPFMFDKPWNQEDFEEMAHMVDEMCKERGWVLNDIHGGNCMIDRKGNFWIVDVGLFRRADDIYLGDGLGDLLWEGKKVGDYHNMKFAEKIAEAV
jgi:hypothetical protein